MAKNFGEKVLYKIRLVLPMATLDFTRSSSKAREGEGRKIIEGKGNRKGRLDPSRSEEKIIGEQGLQENLG
jgi:hypothetical protein